jgi:hypothetical protein
MMRNLIAVLTMFFLPLASFAQDLDPKDVKLTLDKAFPIAIAKASQDFKDLKDYIFYSVNPRVLKGDPKGLHWLFLWQGKKFPHDQAVVVRVYMSDGTCVSERGKGKGTYQLEHEYYLKP